MTYFLKKHIAWVIALNMIFFSYGCNNSADPGQKPAAVTTNTDPGVSNGSHDIPLKVGGLYLSKNENGRYSVSKIIAMDNFAVHVRMYADKFQSKPTALNSANLKVLIGHAPMDVKGFLAEDPELLKIEEVKESELEGYKIYLDEMQR